MDVGMMDTLINIPRVMLFKVLMSCTGNIIIRTISHEELPSLTNRYAEKSERMWHIKSPLLSP